MADLSFVNNTSKTADQIYADVLTGLKSLAPGISTTNPADPFMLLLRVYAAIGETEHFSLDRITRHAILATCQRFDKAVFHAEALDYRVKGATPATVDLTFSINEVTASPVIIPEGTRVETTGGIPFFLTESLSILPGGLTVTGGAIQRLISGETEIALASGEVNAKFVIDEEGVADTIFEVKVGGARHEFQETFAYSKPESLHFVNSINETGQMQIRFGDGNNGAVPGAGQSITATYYTTLGEEGNAGEGEITQIISPISLPAGIQIECTNTAAATGGLPADDLLAIKFKAPAFRSVLERFITEDDYKAGALLVAGVLQTGIVLRDCTSIDIYIVPAGGGLAASSLLSTVGDFIEERRAIGYTVRTLAAGILPLDLSLTVYTSQNFDNDLIIQDVKNQIVSVFAPENQELNGFYSESIVYDSVLNLPEIQRAVITQSKITPFPRTIFGDTPFVLSFSQIEGTTYLNWEITAQTPTRFEIRIDGTTVAIVDKDEDYTNSGVTFRITSTHIAGERAEFFSYPINEDVDLREQSIFQVLEDNISVTVIKS